jgi:ADP-ribose pyrophosphatase YjhB (NUDIX family)
MKHEEQPAEALSRELREEIGLPIWPGKPIAVYVQPGRRHIDHLYVVRVGEDVAIERVAQTEIAAARWFPPSGLPPMQPEARIAFEHFRDASAATVPSDSTPD